MGKELSELEIAKLTMKGAIAEMPVKERSEVESGISRVRACLEEEPQQVRPIILAALFFDYTKELGIE